MKHTSYLQQEENMEREVSSSTSLALDIPMDKISFISVSQISCPLKKIFVPFCA